MKEQMKNALHDFAVKINREVGVRAYGFSATTLEERRWHAQGVVWPYQLDCVKELAPLSNSN